MKYLALPTHLMQASSEAERNALGPGWELDGFRILGFSWEWSSAKELGLGLRVQGVGFRVYM